MAAAKKTPAVAEAKAEKKTRTPKPVVDLASATVALNAAKRKADRTAKARAAAVAEDGLAQTELEQSKAAVQKFYRELMGESVDAPAEDEPEFRELDPVDEYEGAGHNAE